MYIAFPADEKVKARLDSVCKSLGITYEEWFETALIESEHDVLTEVLSGDKPNGCGMLIFVGLFAVLTLNKRLFIGGI